MHKLISTFLAGGPVMWPILALSVIGLAILIWKALRIKEGSTSRSGMVIVSTIITAEPMLGILGTVTGIMQTFSALNGAGMSIGATAVQRSLESCAGNPLAATAGIGEALITTAAGLIAALILIFPYNIVNEKL